MAHPIGTGILYVCVCAKAAEVPSQGHRGAFKSCPIEFVQTAETFWKCNDQAFARINTFPFLKARQKPKGFQGAPPAVLFLGAFHVT